MTRTAAVLFDFGGTLEADGVHWSPRFHAAYRIAGGALDFAAFDPLFKRAEVGFPHVPGIRGFGFRETIEALAGLVVPLLPDGERVDARGIAAVFDAEARTVVARNLPVLERLARRYPLGIVSNFTGNLMPCLEELGLARLFAAVSDSGVVGIAKPAPGIFLETLNALGARADAAWMVGDNFEADIRAAAGLGARTCWIAPPERALPAGLAPTARIARFPEIERVLD
jgi:FMN phosphatase YigB (HAD superfamily)